jgi:glutamate:Na+ symporter, ESS family
VNPAGPILLEPTAGESIDKKSHPSDKPMEFGSFATFNLAILVLALGKFLTRKMSFLREFNIPEPVTGGLLATLVFALIYSVTGWEIGFNLAVRNFLLLYFFAAIGLNSDLKTLLSGGWPLVLLVAMTVVFMLMQNVIGVGVAQLVGLEPLVGLIGGTVSLIGGHGTTIAWAPTFIEQHGIAGAMEIGVACATVGLVLASLMGGPIAKILITRNKLQPAKIVEPDIGITHNAKPQDIDYAGLLATLFWLNVSLAIGQLIQEALLSAGMQLPLFVCCLFGAIFLTNSIPRLVPRLNWPAGSRSLALVSDVSLGIFLAMSLMSLQLWTLIDLAGPIFVLLAVQFCAAFLFALFLVFRVMGRDYEAAVICAGFGGISLGATPTAMANMTAVAQRYGQAHKAFIIVPLVSGFFVDIANAIVIQRFIAWFG